MVKFFHSVSAGVRSSDGWPSLTKACGEPWVGRRYLSPHTTLSVSEGKLLYGEGGHRGGGGRQTSSEDRS